MKHTTKPISPLRQRMLDDMALRKLAPETQSHYLRAVIHFTRFLRRYQLHLVKTGTSSISLNAARKSHA